MLQAQLIPEEMQAGRLDEPYTTYVVQLEGTMLRKEFDRQAGFKHMIRPHAEDALRLVAKEGKGKAHVWFWGSESQAQASVMTESLFLGTDVSRPVRSAHRRCRAIPARPARAPGPLARAPHALPPVDLPTSRGSRLRVRRRSAVWA